MGGVMERKIGDVFTFNEKQLEVIEGDCEDCYVFKITIYGG